MPPEGIIAKLSAAGYVREDPLTNEGQFSNRGGIIDVWPPGAANPLRIEFFGDTIDSIREFDAETQLSITHVDEAAIPPMRPTPTRGGMVSLSMPYCWTLRVPRPASCAGNPMFCCTGGRRIW